MQFLKFLLEAGISRVRRILSQDHEMKKKVDGDAYNYSFTSLIDNKSLPLSQFRGQVLLIVNTASRCGFTKQYRGLQELYNRYRNNGLVIIGIPSNDFGNQEPGTSQEIDTFCKLNYNITFLITSKQIVTGNHAHPFFRWSEKVLGSMAAPKWNFYKYLIDRNGQLVKYFDSAVTPDDKELISNIESLI